MPVGTILESINPSCSCDLIGSHLVVLCQPLIFPCTWDLVAVLFLVMLHSNVTAHQCHVHITLGYVRHSHHACHYYRHYCDTCHTGFIFLFAWLDFVLWMQFIHEMGNE